MSNSNTIGDSPDKRLKLTVKVTAVGKENPADDFDYLISTQVEDETLDDDDVVQENFARIAGEMRAVISDLLFKSETFDTGKIRKALELYREHAVFHNPWDYNVWIKDVKKQIVERKMFDFWKEVIVKKQLGLAWARDCDFFDDMEDPEPPAFYKLEGEEDAVEPEKGAVEEKTSEKEKPKVAEETVAPTKSVQEATPKITAIGKETPAEDFKYLIGKEVDNELLREEKVIQANFKRLAEQMRAVISELLFKSESDQTEKAAKALQMYREQAAFFDPYAYNDWIRDLKKQIAERKMVAFWKDVIVKKQLGLLWAKDCEFFDDRDDPEPMEFYKLEE